MSAIALSASHHPCNLYQSPSSLFQRQDNWVSSEGSQRWRCSNLLASPKPNPRAAPHTVPRPQRTRRLARGPWRLRASHRGSHRKSAIYPLRHPYTTASFSMRFFDWHAIARAISLSELSAACASNAATTRSRNISMRISAALRLNPMECPNSTKSARSTASSRFFSPEYKPMAVVGSG